MYILVCAHEYLCMKLYYAMIVYSVHISCQNVVPPTLVGREGSGCSA